VPELDHTRDDGTRFAAVIEVTGGPHRWPRRRAGGTRQMGRPALSRRHTDSLLIRSGLHPCRRTPVRRAPAAQVRRGLPRNRFRQMGPDQRSGRRTGVGFRDPWPHELVGLTSTAGARSSVTVCLSPLPLRR
jgi:hypothetical protein